MPQTQHQLHTHPLTRTDLIRALDQEVDRLLQAKWLLTHDALSINPWHKSAPAPKLVELMRTPSVIDLAHPPKSDSTVRRPRRKLSPAARRRISEAQTARWKKFHQQQRSEKKSA